MQLDKFTTKAQSALQEAQAIAREFSHQALDGEHLLLALLRQTDGLVLPLVQRLGVAPAAITAAVETQLGSRPKVSGVSS
ncbi:MAG TPA: hypothetical protein DCY13_20420, partial [Verrucomicrobiales bacterium]|nr:hypothetical protein [Verrucomicrobiales bacterium]